MRKFRFFQVISVQLSLSVGSLPVVIDYEDKRTGNLEVDTDVSVLCFFLFVDFRQFLAGLI